MELDSAVQLNTETHVMSTGRPAEPPATGRLRVAGDSDSYDGASLSVPDVLTNHANQAHRLHQ
jgi:hypothetical protein